MASEALWAVVSSLAWAGYTRFSARVSRRFDWSGASELLRLAGPDRAADNRARPGGQACVPVVPVETGASPRCGFPPAGPSRSRVSGAPASANTTVVDP